MQPSDGDDNDDDDGCRTWRATSTRSNEIMRTCSWSATSNTGFLVERIYIFWLHSVV